MGNICNSSKKKPKQIPIVLEEPKIPVKISTSSPPLKIEVLKEQNIYEISMPSMPEPIEIPSKPEPIRMVKKPIILIYNYEPDQEITININLNKSMDTWFSVYPTPQKIDQTSLEWKIRFVNNETIQFLDNNKFYPYLFWETKGSSYYEIVKNNNVFYCFQKDLIDEKLDFLLEKKGLNFKERCDMITYWLPKLKKSEYVKIWFLEQELYDSQIKLQITPKPQNLLRIMMCFMNVSNYEECPFVENFKTFNREGPTVVEWGGQQLKQNY